MAVDSLLLQWTAKLGLPAPPIQPLPGFAVNNQVSILRLDVLHPQISGNKWYKLQQNLATAQSRGLNTIITFGGAYSNHIYATAAAGGALGFKTIGIIRGEKTLPLNTTLAGAAQNGMQLVYVDRETYRQKEDAAFLKNLQNQYGPAWIIPEGGANCQGVTGAAHIGAHIPNGVYSNIVLACGTATTLAGLATLKREGSSLTGISVLKGEDGLTAAVQAYHETCGLTAVMPWQIVTGYHFGGYGKRNLVVNQFIADFKGSYGIPLDGVYTAKMLLAVKDLSEKGLLGNGPVLAIHTGGLRPEDYL